MEWERIRKRPEDYVGANLVNYDESAKAFSWAQARALLDGLPGGGLNIAYEAVDRHVTRLAAAKRISFHDLSKALDETRFYFDTDHLNRAGLTLFFHQELKKLLAGIP